MNSFARYNELIAQGKLPGAPAPITTNVNGSWVCTIDYLDQRYNANCINKKDSIHECCNRLLNAVNPPETPRIRDCRKAFLASGGHISYKIDQIDGKVKAEVVLITAERISRTVEFSGVNYHEIDNFTKGVCKDMLVTISESQKLNAELAAESVLDTKLEALVDSNFTGALGSPVIREWENGRRKFVRVGGQKSRPSVGSKSRTSI